MSSDITCSICLTDIKPNETFFETNCKHIFHDKCIKPWFEKSSQCPNCRKKLFETNSINERINYSYRIDPRLIPEDFITVSSLSFDNLW